MGGLLANIPCNQCIHISGLARHCNIPAGPAHVYKKSLTPTNNSGLPRVANFRGSRHWSCGQTVWLHQKIRNVNLWHVIFAWWRHDTEPLSTLLALCDEDPPVTLQSYIFFYVVNMKKKNFWKNNWIDGGWSPHVCVNELVYHHWFR